MTMDVYMVGWDDDSRARYEQRRHVAADEYAQWRGLDVDAADDGEDDDDGDD